MDSFYKKFCLFTNYRKMFYKLTQVEPSHTPILLEQERVRLGTGIKKE